MFTQESLLGELPLCSPQLGPGDARHAEVEAADPVLPSRLLGDHLCRGTTCEAALAGGLELDQTVELEHVPSHAQVAPRPAGRVAQLELCLDRAQPELDHKEAREGLAERLGAGVAEEDGLVDDRHVGPVPHRHPGRPQLRQRHPALPGGVDGADARYEPELARDVQYGAGDPENRQMVDDLQAFHSVARLVVLDAVAHPGSRSAVLGDVDQAVARTQDRELVDQRRRRVADGVGSTERAVGGPDAQQLPAPQVVERLPVIRRGEPPSAHGHPPPTCDQPPYVSRRQPLGDRLVPRDQPVGSWPEPGEPDSIHVTTLRDLGRSTMSVLPRLWTTGARGSPVDGWRADGGL